MSKAGFSSSTVSWMSISLSSEKSVSKSSNSNGVSSIVIGSSSIISKALTSGSVGGVDSFCFGISSFIICVLGLWLGLGVSNVSPDAFGVSLCMVSIDTLSFSFFESSLKFTRLTT